MQARRAVTERERIENIAIAERLRREAELPTNLRVRDAMLVTADRLEQLAGRAPLRLVR